MEESIRNEIIKSLEVGKSYFFKSTYNGGGYDWSNLEIFSISMRFAMQLWLEETSICGFAVDVSLLRTSDEELDFTLHAHQTSSEWYTETNLSFYDLSQDVHLKRYFGEDINEIRVLFNYLFEGGKSTFELNQSAEAMLLSDDEESFIPNDKLPSEFIEDLRRFIDSFSQGLSNPEGFILTHIEISCDDIYTDEITVYESWQQTYSFSLNNT